MESRFNTPQEARQALVEALRSGRYPQGHGALRSVGGYCCLGVACDISGMGEWVAQVSGRYLYELGLESETSFMPYAVARVFGWSEVGDTDISDATGVERYALASLNDAGLTFDQIADVIEAGLVAEVEP